MYIAAYVMMLSLPFLTTLRFQCSEIHVDPLKVVIKTFFSQILDSFFKCSETCQHVWEAVVCFSGVLHLLKYILEACEGSSYCCCKIVPNASGITTRICNWTNLHRQERLAKFYRQRVLHDRMPIRVDEPVVLSGLVALKSVHGFANLSFWSSEERFSFGG